MTTPHKHAAVIKAWADGALIEYRPGPAREQTLGGWQVSATPGWYESCEYRVKPTTKTVTIQDGIATLEDGTQVDLNVLQKHLYQIKGISYSAGMKNLVLQQGLRHLTGKVWLDGELVAA